MKKRVSGALESYLEQIAELQQQYGAVRTSDLAERMGFKRSSVTSALKRLSEEGLINYQPYRPVTLTEEGKKTISALSRYHNILADFLENILAFSVDFSQEEACRLEHKLSSKTMERLKNYIEFRKSQTGKENYKNLAKEFSSYLKNKTS